MKIFTFNAPEDTRVEILWPLRSKNRDKIFGEFVAKNQFTEVNSLQDCQIAIYPEKAFNPETLVFNSSVYDAAEKAKKYSAPIIIDATSDSDVFLNIPTANILRCGLYRSLKKPFETECPFWSNYRTKKGLDSLDVLSKGQKPAVGFCGTTSSLGKLANISKRIVPNAIARSILSQGKQARSIDVRLIEGMSLQLRETAMKILISDRRINSFFELTNNYRSYYIQNDSKKIALENLFIANTNKCDYVLCVRGSGNYSGRFYMALNAGRIPVVIDTDVVIPFEEHFHIIKVPLNSLENIGDIISEHFETATEQELIEMKLANRAAYHQFLSPEKFLPRFLEDCIKYSYQKV
jgi:hypothetical protein